MEMRLKDETKVFGWSELPVEMLADKENYIWKVFGQKISDKIR